MSDTVSDAIAYLLYHPTDDTEIANMLRAAVAEVHRLRAIIDAPRVMLFADGREPSTNERHLANLLDWARKGEQRAKEELRHVRVQCELAVLNNPEVVRLRGLLEMIHDRYEAALDCDDIIGEEHSAALVGVHLGKAVHLTAGEQRTIVDAIRDTEVK